MSIELLKAFVANQVPLIKDTVLYENSILDYVLREGYVEPEGLWLEFGVYKGKTIKTIAKYCDDVVYGFDSFYGLPEDWVNYNNRTIKQVKGHFNLDGQLPDVPPNVQLIKGLFKDTLPKFRSHHKDKRISLLHIDCDLYSSTKTVFDYLTPQIGHNTVIVFDELINYEGFEYHEMRVFYEFLRRRRDLCYKWLAFRGIKGKRTDPNLCSTVAVKMFRKIPVL